MARVQGLEPKDPYKVWEVIALKKKDDATVRLATSRCAKQALAVSAAAEVCRVCLLVLLLCQACIAIAREQSGIGGAEQPW
jgi:hypothetical protein